MNEELQAKLDYEIPTALYTISFGELNTEDLQERIRKMVVDIIKDDVDTVMVKNDETINTPEVIDNKEFKILVKWCIDKEWSGRIYTIKYTNCEFDEVLD